MNRKIKPKDSKFSEPLSVTVEKLVDSNGGWLNVIGRMTNTFDSALRKLGTGVDCPFSSRHSSGGNGGNGGKGAFRLSASTEKKSHIGRGICTCMQDGGMSAVELLMEDGIGTDYTSCLLAVFKALNRETGSEHVRKETTPVVVRPAASTMSAKDVAWRLDKLNLIARELVIWSHPSAAPMRRYFANRGIPLNDNLQDVRFHPGLEYWVDGEKDSGKKVLVGIFPAIVSAFRSKDGRLVNFHRIYITEDGHKAPVSKVKKICAPLPRFQGSSISIASSEGRVLHVTEGVEKGWAVHLATDESVKAAYSCSSLPKLHVDKAKYDVVVIWSDCDPINRKRQRKVGDGQYFAWELARRLFTEGFDVIFMMPDGNPADVKGRDWEDVIVEEGVLDLTGSYYRFQTLKTFAAKGGVHKQHRRVA